MIAWMYDPAEDDAPVRRRARRVSPVSRAGEGPRAIMPSLSEEFLGLPLAYANTLLFVGYEVDGKVEITVFPRSRFSSDDRVQGHLGRVWAPFGTPWESILGGVDGIYSTALQNYRYAVSQRAAELRAHGARYEAAYDAITDIFRECWHGFALKLRREGSFVKEGVAFEARPPAAVLATWRGEPYTVKVFPTGSILLMRGERTGSLPAD